MRVKVETVIDTRVETLKEEQTHDDHMKEYCTSQLDLSDDKRKRRLVQYLMQRVLQRVQSNC